MLRRTRPCIWLSALVVTAWYRARQRWSLPPLKGKLMNVGKLSGYAAAQILLDNVSASDIPVQTVTEPTYCYNGIVCSRLGLTVPDNATDVGQEN